MQKVRVESFAISIDGYGAGLSQSLENPLGIDGMELHNWFRPTEVFKKNVMGESGGDTGIDNDFAKRGFENIGAWILGRNMFDPNRGPWKDDNWVGWWGESPPYQCPVYILTHYPRESIEMKGGTIFHFETEGIDVALNKAKKSAGSKDVRIGGGTKTIRQFLEKKLIDELHLVISPIFLGSGESLFQNLNLKELGYKIKTYTNSDLATHLEILKNKS